MLLESCVQLPNSFCANQLSEVIFFAENQIQSHHQVKSFLEVPHLHFDPYLKEPTAHMSICWANLLVRPLFLPTVSTEIASHLVLFQFLCTNAES